MQMGHWDWNEAYCYVSSNEGLGGQSNRCPLYPVTFCSYTLGFPRKREHFFFSLSLSEIHIHCPEALDLPEVFGKQ